MKEALFYEKLDKDKVHCRLCPQHCIILPGKRGLCRVRENRDGTLYSLVYGRVSSQTMDPIEKKPLYHFYPGRGILSLGTIGCNLRCQWCQNWHISQEEAPTHLLSPESAVELARKNRSIGIAFTYNEPLISYEYVRETARLAHQAGLVNVLVTNGFIDPEPLDALIPCIDAANIDVKAFHEDFYRKHCNGQLAPVMRAVERTFRLWHVELTNLLIPGLNDSDEEIRDLVGWIAGLDPNIPLHFSRYFPRYRCEIPPTPYETMERARTIALETLPFVYLGNVADEEASTTYCPSCHAVLIARLGCTISPRDYRDGKCQACGAAVPIID